VRRYDGLRAPSTWEKGGYRPVFARISPYFAGASSPWLGRAWISRHPVEIQAVSGVGLCGGMTACPSANKAHRRGRWAGTDPYSPGSRLILQDLPRRGPGGLGSRDIRSRSERFRGPSGSGCAAVRRPAYRAHRRGRGACFDPSSLGSRLVLQDPPHRGPGGPGSRDIRSRSKRFRGPSGSGCAAVRRPA
jgi:hypothetical protein